MVSPLDSLGEKLAVQAAAASKRYAAQLKELGEMGSEPGGASGFGGSDAIEIGVRTRAVRIVGSVDGTIVAGPIPSTSFNNKGGIEWFVGRFAGVSHTGIGSTAGHAL